MTKECGYILGLLVGKTEHHYRESVDLDNKRRDVILPPNYSLASFYLGNMFTNLNL